jgi:SnoaL-like domain
MDQAEVAARLEIVDLLHRYCRGIDRCDVDSLKGVFWPDGTCDYGSGAQNAYDWSEATVGALQAMPRTMHQVSNWVIEVDGDAARAETYCQAYHEMAGPDGLLEVVVGGRYLDRLEKRGVRWGIRSRDYIMDWNRNVPSTAQWDGGLYAGLKRTGKRYPDDAAKAFWAGQ